MHRTYNKASQQSTLNYNQIIKTHLKIAYTEGAYKPIPICTKYEAGSFNWRL